MTPLHTEHAAVVTIANRLFEVDEVAWRVMLARAHRLDVTLLALIYHRLREVRDDVARQAFSEQRSIAEVARERLAAAREMKPDKPYRSQVREAEGLPHGFARAGGKSCSQ